MKEILSIVLSTFVFILAIPLAYGQQLDTVTNIDATTNQTMATMTTTPEATLGKSENLTSKIRQTMGKIRFTSSFQCFVMSFK